MRIINITNNIVSHFNKTNSNFSKQSARKINKDGEYSSFQKLNAVSFKAKVPKVMPTAEEIAKRKAMEIQAIQQRQAMPKILQMLYPLPVSSGIKAKHVQDINKKILSDEFIDKHPLLKDSIQKFLFNNDQKSLNMQEDSALNNMMYSKEMSKQFFIGDVPYSQLLDRAFENIPELKGISINDKALILSILKSFGVDGGEFIKNGVKDYKNLIQYAKDNRERLTEPVEQILSDNEIDKYFENNKTKSIIALLTIGGHPARQRLEQRLNKFDRTLETINFLFKIPEIREDLVTICNNQNKVNPAEIIKFMELSKGALDLGLKLPDLKKNINNSILENGINVDYLSKEYLKLLAIKNGEKKALDFTDWDLSNVYTIPYFLNNNSEYHRENFKNLFLSTLYNNYHHFIHDSSQPHGLGNRITKELFKQNKLDYNKWLNYDKVRNLTLLPKSDYIKTYSDSVSNSKFPKQSEELCLRVWKRIPARDLFQGSTAGQCIALDGVNGFAGVDELLYTYAQLVEIINNAKNKSIGNACLYWIKDKNDKKALLIDSIGIHTEYENNPQIRNEIFSFVQEYGNTVAGQPVDIYIGNQFNKLEVKDLSEPIKDEFQIIGSTGGKQTYLDAIIAKNRHDRYTTIDNKKPFLMEIRKI